MEPFPEVLSAAKSAAETYSRHPSTANAEKLDAAWRTILKLDNLAQIRRAATERAGSHGRAAPRCASAAA